MQQTSKYQFKLIEGTDDFSPTPLNDNMEKVEEKLSELNDTVTQHAAAIGTGGHTCRIAFGSYQGSGTYGAGSPNSLSFDFYPVLVMLQGVGMPSTGALLRGSGMGDHTWQGGGPMTVAWTNNSVSWYSEESSAFQSNISGIAYFYVAVGYTQ